MTQIEQWLREEGMKEGEIKAKLETARATLWEDWTHQLLKRSLTCHWKPPEAEKRDS